MAVAAVSCHRKRRREGESRVEGRGVRGGARGRYAVRSEVAGRRRMIRRVDQFDAFSQVYL